MTPKQDGEHQPGQHRKETLVDDAIHTPDIVNEKHPGQDRQAEQNLSGPE